MPLKNFSWTIATPATYHTPDGVQRHFCGTCGSPVGVEADHYPGGMHLYAASMENPANFTPTFYVNIESKLPWLELQDELTRYTGTLLQSSADAPDYRHDLSQSMPQCGTTLAHLV